MIKSVSIASMLAAIAVGSTQQKIAKYDAIPPGPPPNPYKNLTYTNMVVTTIQNNLATESGHHYIVATNQFDFSITGSDYFMLDSLYLGCVECIGTACAGGHQPSNCTIQAVGVVTEGLPTNHVEVSYVAPDPNGNGSGSMYAPMQKVDMQGVGGLAVHFSLVQGTGDTDVFIDDLKYLLQ